MPRLISHDNWPGQYIPGANDKNAAQTRFIPKGEFCLPSLTRYWGSCQTGRNREQGLKAWNDGSPSARHFLPIHPSSLLIHVPWKNCGQAQFYQSQQKKIQQLFFNIHTCRPGEGPSGSNVCPLVGLFTEGCLDGPVPAHTLSAVQMVTEPPYHYKECGQDWVGDKTFQISGSSRNHRIIRS